METLADVLLIAGALSAGVYCLILSRRLKQLNDLENGVGGAVAVMASQVDDMTKTLESARNVSTEASQALHSTTERAEAVAHRLELMLASMHDMPDPPGAKNNTKAAARDLEVTDTTRSSLIMEGPMFMRHRKTSEDSEQIGVKVTND